MKQLSFTIKQWGKQRKRALSRRIKNKIEFIDKLEAENNLTKVHSSRTTSFKVDLSQATYTKTQIFGLKNAKEFETLKGFESNVVINNVVNETFISLIAKKKLMIIGVTPYLKHLLAHSETWHDVS